MRVLLFCCSILILALVAPNEASAYIDPNAGQTIFRFLFPLLAGLVGTSVFLKTQMKRLKSFKQFLANAFSSRAQKR